MQFFRSEITGEIVGANKNSSLTGKCPPGRPLFWEFPDNFYSVFFLQKLGLSKKLAATDMELQLATLSMETWKHLEMASLI